MTKSNKVIVTVAPTGGMATKQHNPNLPTSRKNPRGYLSFLQQMVEMTPEKAVFNVSAIGPHQLNEACNRHCLAVMFVSVWKIINFYYSRGRLARNIEQVDRIVRIIRDLGLEPATPAAARDH